MKNLSPLGCRLTYNEYTILKDYKKRYECSFSDLIRWLIRLEFEQKFLQDFLEYSGLKYQKVSFVLLKKINREILYQNNNAEQTKEAISKINKKLSSYKSINSYVNEILKINEKVELKIKNVDSKIKDIYWIIEDIIAAPRPYIINEFNHQIHVRITQKEKDKIEQNASTFNMKKSTYLRWIIRLANQLRLVPNFNQKQDQKIVLLNQYYYENTLIKYRDVGRKINAVAKNYNIIIKHYLSNINNKNLEEILARLKNIDKYSDQIPKDLDKKHKEFSVLNQAKILMIG